MKVFDLHCDTLSELRYAEKAGTPKSFAQNDLHIDFAQQSDKLIFVRERLSSRASAASRGIYAFRFAFWLIWCEDPSTPLRSAQDDKVFCCLGLPEKHQFAGLWGRGIVNCQFPFSSTLALSEGLPAAAGKNP